MEITEGKNEYAAKKTRGLANDGGDELLALLEGKASELNDNVLRASREKSSGDSKDKLKFRSKNIQPTMALTAERNSAGCAFDRLLVR
ncbi:hypothetical protein WN944_021405 [Citrus x changshan-huyou]|uniref:Uncharacterized protein n=1 Tax=Citrus x changshan-huyou TaxID=2935761 RepID=A0AAP0N336_9ROSI